MSDQEINIPKVLWKHHVSGATGVLGLKKSNIEKNIYFLAGQVIHAESNLLHETLGKFLVTQKIISSEQEQTALARSVETQQNFGQSLVHLNFIDPATLSQAIRMNLQSKIQECLSWTHGQFAFKEGLALVEKQTPFHIDLLRVFLGASWDGQYEGHAFFRGEKKVKLTLPKDLDLRKMELTVNEVACMKTVQKPILFKDVCEKLRLPVAEVASVLHVLLQIGFAQEVSSNEELSLDELVGLALLQQLQATPAAVAVAEVDAETLAIANEVAQNHLSMGDMNYFELFGLAETATFVQVRDRFLEFSKKFNPARFDSPKVKQFSPQAEEVFLRGVKAYSILSEFDAKTKYLDKIKAERISTDDSKKKKAGEAFKIQTHLLDADSQFQKGIVYLKAKNFIQAHEFFSYACDIDSTKLDYIAHLAWAKFQMNPERNKNDTKEIFERAVRTKIENAFVEFFFGKFLADTGQPKEAIVHLKKASQLDPKSIEFVRELRRVEGLK